MGRLSKKRAKQNRLYSKLRKKFLEDNPICQAGLEGCSHQATECHHKAGRTGKKLTDIENFLAVCHWCHLTLEHEPLLAKENGLSKSRLT